MAFVGAPGGTAVNSNPIQTKVGTSQTNIFTATSTQVTQGTDGKVNGGTTTLFFSPSPDNYVPAATTTDGGKTWTYLKDSSGKEILGADAKKSLEQGALKNNTQEQIKSAATKASIPKEQQKVLATQTKNTATESAGGDQAGGTTSVAELTEGIKDDKEKIRQQYGNWRYPVDMNSTQDRIKFTMYRYATKTFNESGVLTGNAFGERPLGASMGSVVLPIQPSISDSNRVQWGETPMDPGQQAFSGLSLSAMAGGTEGVNQAVSGLNADTTGAVTSAVVTGLAEKAGGVTGGGLLTRLTGGVQNTNLELLFQGPTLRSFSFTFSMSARSDKEAKTIRNIIRFFKQGMSVKRATSNLFIMSPNIFTVKYYYGGESTEHPWINKIKECALTDCSVNYTPAAIYATYEDGAMTQYDITLNFGELDFIYDDMYGNGGGTGDETEIGY